MSNLETPLPPRTRTANGAAGTVATTGKDPKTRAGGAGRDERGSVFGALLASVNAKTPQGSSASADKNVEGALTVLAEEGETAESGVAVDLPAAAARPDASNSADAAARLLLGAFQAPAREAHDARKESGKRDGAAAAALGSALAEAGRSGPRDTMAKPVPMPSDEPGIAMPSEDAAVGDLPDPSALTRLSELVDADAPSSEAAGEDAFPLKPLTMTVVRQETYLPPVMRLSPFQQVVEPIRQAAAELATARLEASDAPGTPGEITTPTKILHLELRPVELGSLVVKMRLSQGGMEIRIEASRAETAQMLANDKDALREIVKASGFSADAVSVETIHIEGLGADRKAPPGQDGPQGDGFQPREGRDFGQPRQGGQQEEPRRRDWTSDATTKDDIHDIDDAHGRGRDPHRYL